MALCCWILIKEPAFLSEFTVKTDGRRKYRRTEGVFPGSRYFGIRSLRKSFVSLDSNAIDASKTDIHVALTQEIDGYIRFVFFESTPTEKETRFSSRDGQLRSHKKVQPSLHCQQYSCYYNVIIMFYTAEVICQRQNKIFVWFEESKNGTYNLQMYLLLSRIFINLNTNTNMQLTARNLEMVPFFKTLFSWIFIKWSQIYDVNKR